MEGAGEAMDGLLQTPPTPGAGLLGPSVARVLGVGVQSSVPYRGLGTGGLCFMALWLVCGFLGIKTWQG